MDESPNNQGRPQTPLPPQPQAELPPMLVDDLKTVFARRIDVPGELDQRITEQAHDHLSGMRYQIWRRRFTKIGAAGGIAAAAAIVLATYLQPAVDTPLPSASPVVRSDVDASGRVDILDALALARMLESGQMIDLTWDLNGDQTVDQLDVDSLAREIVKLNKGARS